MANEGLCLSELGRTCVAGRPGELAHDMAVSRRTPLLPYQSHRSARRPEPCHHCKFGIPADGHRKREGELYGAWNDQKMRERSGVAS